MRRSFITLLTITVVLSMAASAMAVQCQSTDRPCVATTSVTLYTGSPIPVCLQGVPVVRIQTTANCIAPRGAPGGSSASGVFIKCGLDSDGYTWTGAGQKHGISLYPGQQWQHVYQGRCKAVIYENKPL